MRFLASSIHLDKAPVREFLTNMNYNDVKEPLDNQLSLNLF